MPETDIEKVINSLNDELDRLAKDISDARKHGKDTKMAELVIMGLVHKIRYAELSRDEQDIDNARKRLARARSELDNAGER